MNFSINHRSKFLKAVLSLDVEILLLSDVQQHCLKNYPVKILKLIDKFFKQNRKKNFTSGKFKIRKKAMRK
jgi:hypothetical protein